MCKSFASRTFRSQSFKNKTWSNITYILLITFNSTNNFIIQFGSGITGAWFMRHKIINNRE